MAISYRHFEFPTATTTIITHSSSVSMIATAARNAAGSSRERVVQVNVRRGGRQWSTIRSQKTSYDDAGGRWAEDLDGRVGR
eukprot:CAMPEP_0196144004 /NCGR_PEP_ID=MMETSP0910-20130528/14511_1 /TAXON_ID=49265 /ORGANISM="Thalassiosira rotula, Strain GSO102" /LENGTH=81 /DNA_ID=CAMNT_0041405535 /DNA_START=51 /DNA_END=299 /DNA_ORIENTATION=-